MPLSVEDLRFAADDARRYLQAQVDLMHANDRQAIGFLQLFVALAVAALSGAAAILLSGSAAPLPRPLGFGLGAFGFLIALSAICSLIVLWPAEWRLPGRGVEFWLGWADKHALNSEDTMRAYLEGADLAMEKNRLLNTRRGYAMLAGKILGGAAPLLGLAAGYMAFQLSL